MKYCAICESSKETENDACPDCGAYLLKNPVDITITAIDHVLGIFALVGIVLVCVALVFMYF